MTLERVCHLESISRNIAAGLGSLMSHCNLEMSVGAFRCSRPFVWNQILAQLHSLARPGIPFTDSTLPLN